MNKYPIGPKTMERAANTEAGKLAAALNRVMYDADNAEVMMKSHTNSDGIDQYTTKTRRYVCPDKVFRNKDLLPKGVPAIGNEGYYFETERLFLAIRDYLESAAIREVCD